MRATVRSLPIQIVQDPWHDLATPLEPDLQVVLALECMAGTFIANTLKYTA